LGRCFAVHHGSQGTEVQTLRNAPRGG
jgi:hypothetical protein